MPGREKDGKEMELWLDFVSYICCRTALEGASIDGAIAPFNGVALSSAVRELRIECEIRWRVRSSKYVSPAKCLMEMYDDDLHQQG